MFDYHVHSNHSFDGNSSMMECAEYAVAAGLSEICFTEHQEIDHPNEDAAVKALDYKKYYEDFVLTSERMPKFKMKRGVEVGLQMLSLDKIAKDISGRELDFVIASQHIAKGKDPWFGDFFDGITLREGQEIYLKELFQNSAKFDDFDVIGHIGYVDKYLDNVEKHQHFGKEAEPFEYKDFPEIIDGILKDVISRGKGIEVNTSNYLVHGYPTPHPSIIKRFAELGGEVLTTGSDAHSANRVGYKVKETMELLRACGVRYVCTFTKRKPEFHKI